VSALSQVDLKLSRPLLVHAIEGAETPLFCQVLNQLSGARDPATARFLLAFLQQERFAQRPVEERRAIYAALASVGGDEVVPELEAELFKGNWADRAQEVHRHNVARILARIGRPLARQALEHGAQSKRAPVRQAASMALESLREAA
jgi:HEAT repeat protein